MKFGVKQLARWQMQAGWRRHGHGTIESNACFHAQNASVVSVFNPKVVSVRHLGHLIDVKRTLLRQQIALSIAMGGDEIIGRDLIDPEPVLAKVTQQVGSSVDYWRTSQTGYAVFVIF